MSELGNRLKKRAANLGLSDAEVARRADLNPRRYGFYVTGDREPNYQTLLHICRVLATSPNHLLGFELDEEEVDPDDEERKNLENRLIATGNLLDNTELHLVIDHAELVLKYRKT